MNFIFFSLATATVEVLTVKNFDSFIAEHDLVLVEFYAPWCGHCKTLEPEYAKASEELAQYGPVLAKVDTTVEKELGERFEIKGFPTLKLFRSGSPSAFEGGRTAKDIVSYMKKQMGPAIKVLETTGELAELIPEDEKEDPVVIGFAKEGSDVANFLSKFAQKFRDDYSFGLVTSADVAGEYEMGSIMLFKPFDEFKDVFSGELTDELLSSFLTANSVRAVDEISPSNYPIYVKRGLPISWLFIDSDKKEESDAVIEEYRKVASQFKQQVSFVYLSGTQYQQMATKMGLTGKILPGLAIEHENVHFVHPESTALTVEGMKQWFEQYLSGDLAPTVKSEPRPASLFDENNVAMIVGENFKEVVLDDSKDVLLEFYAPWCGHCKSLVPIWNNLGKTFKGVPSVVIAKSDATANDYPSGFQVAGFPTIQLITSKGNNVIKYAGERKLEPFISWLKENAATPFEIPEAVEGKDEDEDSDEL